MSPLAGFPLALGFCGAQFRLLLFFSFLLFLFSQGCSASTRVARPRPMETSTSHSPRLPPESLQYINFSQLSEVSSGDTDIEQELWSAFEESWDTTRADLERAFTEGNSESARLHSHSLKGASLSIGFDVLAAICKEMESLSIRGDVAGAKALLTSLLQVHEATATAMTAHLRKQK